MFSTTTGLRAPDSPFPPAIVKIEEGMLRPGWPASEATTYRKYRKWETKANSVGAQRLSSLFIAFLRLRAATKKPACGIIENGKPNPIPSAFNAFHHFSSLLAPP